MSYQLYKNGEQTGPFSIGEIQAKLGNGEISDSDFVWKEGMTDWVLISSVIPPPAPQCISHGAGNATYSKTSISACDASFACRSSGR
jgi:hypothetical protein